MTSSEKSGKLKKADVLALLNREIKPDFDAPSPASSVVSGPDTPSILASDHLPKAHVKKLEGKTAKLIAKRQRLENAVDAERALLSRGRPTAAASPAWSRNMEALLERVEWLSAKEMSHMADLATKLDLVEKALAQKETTKKRKAVEAMRKIHDQFHKHLEPYYDYPMKTNGSDTKNEEGSDEDVKVDEESLKSSDKDEVAEDAKMTLEKEFERASRHMKLDDCDPAEIPSDVEEAIMRSAAKRVLRGGFKAINTLNNPYHSHATADHGFNYVIDDDPFFEEEKSTPTKSKKDKKDKKKRKRESIAETAAEMSDDEHETPKKKTKKTKNKKSKKLKSVDHDSGEDVKNEDSPKEDSPKKAKKAKKSKKDRDASPVWTVPRRYSTSVIPLPVIPPQALAHITQSASKQTAAPTGPPVPIAAPVAPNSSRRRSLGPFSSPKKRVFSSIRHSPPPVMGGMTTPQHSTTQQWVLEGDTSRARAKSTSGKVTMTIGAHPPVRPREASPAEAAGQKRRPGRPKGSKTQSRKAVIAGSPPFISTTPIPLPTYATRPHNEDLVRMVIPDVSGRPVLASSPPRGNMTLEDRLQQDRAMYAEERARWFQLMGIPDPAARF